jgi:hypothetical protein
LIRSNAGVDRGLRQAAACLAWSEGHEDLFEFCALRIPMKPNSCGPKAPNKEERRCPVEALFPEELTALHVAYRTSAPADIS